VKNVAVQSGAWNIVPLFGKNPVQYSVNGSLWSVTFEVCFYLCAATSVAARRVPPVLTIVGAIVATVVAWKAPLMVICFTGAALLWRSLVPAGYGKAGLFSALYLVQLANTIAPEQLRAFLDPVYFLVWPMLNSAWCLSALMFLGGMLWWQFRAKLVWRHWMVALAVIALIGGAIFHVWPFVAPLLLPYLVLFLAARLPFQKFEKLGDPSYGIYLFSFPIQQILAWGGVHHGGVAFFALASIAASALAGILSWIAIEKPALTLGKRVGRWYERPALASHESADALVEVPKA
jgi:peptidoglycan/LPS O-acetylase OafA/YrhL